MTARSIDISIVGPAMNEAGNLEEYVERCFEGFRSAAVEGEIILVDDGSTDATRDVIRRLLAQHPDRVRGFANRGHRGLTEALKVGFAHARGTYVAFVATDLECHPDEDIPLFMEGFREGADAVAGRRRTRGDGKKVASVIYNALSNLMFGMTLRDMNWIKAFRTVGVHALDLRGESHRFLLMMLHMAGFRVVEKEMNWYPRRYGKSKFGLMRIPRSLVDAIGIWFLLTFSRKPMRLFGSLGMAAVAIGVLIQLFLVVHYLAGLGQIRPLFWIGIGLVLSGLQLVLVGFVAEQIERLRGEVDGLRRQIGAGGHTWIELEPPTQ